MDTLQEIERLEAEINRKTKLSNNKKTLCQNCERDIGERYFECVMHSMVFCIECSFEGSKIMNADKESKEKIIDCHKFILNDAHNCIMEKRIKIHE